MDQNLTGTTDRPPSYSSIAAESAASQYPQPTAAETAPAAPQAIYVYEDAPYIPQQQQHVPSFDGLIIFACVVMWLFNFIFGLIAFILASKYIRCVKKVAILSQIIISTYTAGNLQTSRDNDI